MNLSEYSGSLARACAEAGRWVAKNGEVVRNEQDALAKELRRAGRLFRRCALAAGRKMCAGVFGPSQAGKSYLISALARDESGALQARFGEEMHNFVSEINPTGGKESTGLVTRFTMTRPASLPAGHPVQIRLLTETDLVKIIANTYFADCEHKEDPQSDIRATLEKLKKRVREPNPEEPPSPVDLDALEDLREYLRGFAAKARVQELERGFWTQALSIGPRLALDDRILLYALIWDEVDQFTGLLRRLLFALDRLGHSDLAFCPMSALIPKEGSIIDVATLEGLEGGADAEGRPAAPETTSAATGADLELTTPEGKSATLPRAVVTALTAELTIVMDQKPAAYFEHTDLLDFPGYRSRYKFEDVRTELQRKQGLLKEMFLRGKVAYLFQRYCAERELTSMILCIGSGPQEVQDLPGVINDWVSGTHGKNPADRADKRTSLLFVLTKSDMEFEEKAGATAEGRWDIRLHASLLDFFGKQHDWPHDWNGRGAFDNLFLLRNPNVKWNAMDHDSQGRELGIVPGSRAFAEAMETDFMKSDLVAAHFRDPRVAWDALMTLNDGGISRIKESLSPLCDPEIKKQQLLQSIGEERQRILDRLRAFYFSDDKEETRRQKKDLFVNRLAPRLGGLERQHQRLGKLINRLTISDAEIADLHPEALQLFLDQPEEEPAAPAPAQPASGADLDGETPGWNPFDDEAFAESTETQIAPRDEEAFFAAYIEKEWVTRLHALAGDPNLQRYFQLPDQEFGALVSELATGADRLNLREQMTADFRRAAQYANTQKDNIVRQQAAIAAHYLNSFVDWLGRDPGRPEAERTVLTPGGEALVFTPLPEAQGFPQLGETREAYTRLWFRDWLNALYALVMDNVNFDGEQVVNAEENTRLGGILEQLRTNPPA